MYEFKSRVRYSEIDQSGQLSLLSLLNYFQDCTTFHSEDIGLGYHRLQERGLVWLMTAWQIMAFRYPALYEDIIIGTAPHDFRGVLGYRNFWLTNEAGEKLAYANSVWTMFDLAKNRPTKLPQDIIDGYALSEKLPMDYADRKIALPDGGAALSTIEVLYHHIDSNNHVNNGQYVSMVLDLLADKRRETVRQLRAEYRKPAVLGDILHPLYHSFDNKELVSLQDAEGEVYCNVELQYG
jgi:acyl-ACP thioesterase